MSKPKIEHLIVLMLENRSFDHMLGYLEYPPEAGFEGVRGREQQMGNPLPDGRTAFPSPTAGYLIDPGPNHSHESVLLQLTGIKNATVRAPVKNNGFALDYDAAREGQGEMALRCFTPERLPVLSGLARSFAVCDRWFCSVPGATWPNRNFAQAATSDGEVNIVTRSYKNKTIYEQLSQGNRDWAIYYGGFPAQTMAFTNLWLTGSPSWLQRFKPLQNLYRAIQADHLPHYAFVEPDMLGKTCDSQHPSMGGEMDFQAGERLIWRIYHALRENMPVFQKTLLVITYDEHGGFFDHVRPPRSQKYRVEPYYQDSKRRYTFRFDRLGLRVPAVLVSPWIKAGTVDHTIYDHASIPATLRKLFQVDALPLTHRDANANTFEQVFNLDQPRSDLPDLPEPFVDEEQRKLAQGVELRDSLAWIVRDMIWNEIMDQASAAAVPFDIPAGGDSPPAELPLSEPPIEDPESLNARLLAEMGDQLSPQAQQIVAETGQETDLAFDLPFASPVHRLAQAAQHTVEKLIAQNQLVDDAMAAADWFIRQLEPHHTILRLADGASYELPGPQQMRQALIALYHQGDPGASVWLADHQDRWVTVFGDRQVHFHDRNPDRAYSRNGVGLEQALGYFSLLQQGKPGALRREFAG